MNLGDIAIIQMGYPFRSRLEHDPEGSVAVIQMKDIDDSNLLHAEEAIRLTLPKVKNHHLLRPGDLVFRSRGRSNGASIVPEGLGPAVLASPMLLVRPHGVLSDYLCWFINMPVTQEHLAALSEGTSVRMISKEALKSLPVPIPPPDAQQRIVELARLAEREQALLATIASDRNRLVNFLLMQHAHRANT